MSIKKNKEVLNFDKEIEIEQEINEEIDDNKLMAYDIAVFYNTYNLSTLMKWWNKKLVIPNFQRSFVWDLKKASEFVDSMLRGLPVPSIFFYDDSENSRFLVVDGQQRLKSLYAFMEERKFSGKKFRLKGNIHPNWDGKTFDELEEEDKNRLEDALMNITVMRQLAPDDGQSAMYLAFQRINTGGQTLRSQEIRMAVSYGPLAIMLNQLAEESCFVNWRFLRTDKQRNNNDYSPIQELILKFWTYYFNFPNFYGSSTRSMLDDFFSDQKDFDNPKRRKNSKKYYSQKEFIDVYNAVIDIISNLSEQEIAPFSVPTQTFLESIWVGLAYRKLKQKKEINVLKLPDYISNWKNVIGENRFVELFQARRTSSVSSAKERIKAGIEYFSGDFDE